MRIGNFSYFLNTGELDPSLTIQSGSQLEKNWQKFTLHRDIYILGQNNLTIFSQYIRLSQFIRFWNWREKVRPHNELTIHRNLLDKLNWSSKVKTYACIINLFFQSDFQMSEFLVLINYWNILFSDYYLWCLVGLWKVNTYLYVIIGLSRTSIDDTLWQIC